MKTEKKENENKLAVKRYEEAREKNWWREMERSQKGGGRRGKGKRRVSEGNFS